MYNIVIIPRDNEKTSKVIFSKNIITLNEYNKEESFSLYLEDGYIVDDFVYAGTSFKIINNGNNTYTAKLREDKILTKDENWFVNFTIVEI